jgi:zeaxanthin glucosyltransferase
MGIPYVHIWTAHHLDFSGATPASLFSWPHETTSAAIDRNVEALKLRGEILAPLSVRLRNLNC